MPSLRTLRLCRALPCLEDDGCEAQPSPVD